MRVRKNDTGQLDKNTLKPLNHTLPIHMMKKETKRLEKPLLALHVALGAIFSLLIGLYFAGVNFVSTYFYAVFMASFAVFVVRG